VVNVKTLGVKVNEETYLKFVKICDRDGCTASDRLRDLIEGMLEKDEEPILVVEDKPKISEEGKRKILQGLTDIKEKLDFI